MEAHNVCENSDRIGQLGAALIQKIPSRRTQSGFTSLPRTTSSHPATAILHLWAKALVRKEVVPEVGRNASRKPATASCQRSHCSSAASIFMCTGAWSAENYTESGSVSAVRPCTTLVPTHPLRLEPDVLCRHHGSMGGKDHPSHRSPTRTSTPPRPSRQAYPPVRRLRAEGQHITQSAQ